MFRHHFFIWSWGLILLSGVSFSEPHSNYEVSLFTGIPPLVKLGDPLSVVKKAIKASESKVDLADFENCPDCKVSQGIQFDQLGLSIFFNRLGANLIIIQAPFKGSIRSKKVELFPLGPPPSGGTWGDFITKELGAPDFIVTGGNLNSRGFFYSWGDISFNASGPNQLALYRDPNLRKYREKSFGRKLRIFPENPSSDK